MIVALLAGEGVLPLRVLEGIKASGARVLLLGVKGSCSQELVEKADHAQMLYPTELGKALRLCQKFGVEEIVFAGRIHHKRIYNLPWIRADFAAIKLWYSLQDKRADTMIKAVCAFFEKAAIKVAPLTRYLTSYLAKEGSTRGLSAEEEADVRLGVMAARGLGALDVGQTAIVKKGAVVALEAMEGTDACIERAAVLAGEGIVVVKMAKPSQDMRFDLPVIGKNTMEKLIKAKARVLAVESGKTVIVDREVQEMARRHGIALVILAEG